MVIFLDFDGVLHSYGELIANYCCYLPKLEAVLREFPQVQIVVSSDWRKLHDLEDLRTFFSADIANRVIGVTPDLSNSTSKIDSQGIRHWEAHAWIIQNNFTGSWIALDDDPDNWLKGDARFIFCDDGFTEIEEQALRVVLADERQLRVVHPGA